MTDRLPVGTAFSVRGGWVALARTERGLCRSTLAEPSRVDAVSQLGLEAEMVSVEDDPVLAETAARIRAYWQGKAVRFDVPLDLCHLPDFTRLVLLACHRIPYGETASYGELASRVGRPGAARAVGQAMRRNPLPIIIPCHRVVGSDGSLVGFAGGTEGLPIKQSLLDREKRDRCI